jgi:hypothetical protein
MRLTETKIQALTDKLFETVTNHPKVTVKGQPNQIAFKIKAAIAEDLRREDALDEEVKRLLEAALKGKNRMSLDYQTLFRKAKATLVRDRKLVI